MSDEGQSSDAFSRVDVDSDVEIDDALLQECMLDRRGRAVDALSIRRKRQGEAAPYFRDHVIVRMLDRSADRAVEAVFKWTGEIVEREPNSGGRRKLKYLVSGMGDTGIVDRSGTLVQDSEYLIDNDEAEKIGSSGEKYRLMQRISEEFNVTALVDLLQQVSSESVSAEWLDKRQKWVGVAEALVDGSVLDLGREIGRVLDNVAISHRGSRPLDAEAVLRIADEAEDVSPQPLVELGAESPPDVSIAQIRSLEAMIAAAQDEPPADLEGKQSFVRGVNRLLDDLALRLLVEGELCRLLVNAAASRTGTIQFSANGRTRGGFSGRRRKSVTVTSVSGRGLAKARDRFGPAP